MFLKSLSMKGFKSFADPTVLEFEPGITVVVGPNGSGKSNVVDAVTWVLGAQGPRSLRSAKMEDVIFAGTSSRPALGRAEVSLTIDNASGKLPIDLAEVTITRTLFRSGDSEYAINGAPCRLLDVQELLSDSGVGRQQHMIIGQGQLDTVLNARPEDRRAIIEEAAGVLKHRRRRERAERRLAGTAENLERLGDLVREVRRQIRPLERQAAAARSHDSVATELLTIRRYLAGAELAELSARRRTAAHNLTICHEEERELHEALEVLDAEASSTSAELSSHREEDLARALGRVQGLVERARGTSGVLRERGRAVVAALDAAADVDVVSTLEAEAARLATEIAQVAQETSADPGAAELEAEALVVEEEEATLRRALGRRAGGRRPGRCPGPGAGAQRAPQPGRGSGAPRSRPRSNARWPRSSSATPRPRPKPTCWRPMPLRWRRRRPAWRRTPPPAGPPWRRPPSVRRTPSGWPTSASRPATAARPGPRPSSGHCGICRAPAGVSCSAGSTAWWARSSIWWRSTTAGKPPSKRRPGPEWPRSWWTAVSRPIRPWRPCASVASPAPCWHPGPARPRSTCPRARGPRPCAATCAPVTGRRSPSPCSMR